MADGFETKRACSLPPPVRPSDAAPTATSSLDERQDWAERFVGWFLSVTGGDPEFDGIPAGHRWRVEYFECVSDPQAFEQRALVEIQLYQGDA